MKKLRSSLASSSINSCTELSIIKGRLQILLLQANLSELHCAKSVRIRRYSGPYFPAFGLSVSSPYAGKKNGRE